MDSQFYMEVENLIKAYAETPTDALEKKLKAIPLNLLTKTLNFNLVLYHLAIEGNIRFLQRIRSIGIAFGDPNYVSLYGHILLGAANGGNVEILKWLREIGADAKFYNRDHLCAINGAVAHEQIQVLLWYKENVCEVERWDKYYAPIIISTAVQLGYMKVLHWIETFGALPPSTLVGLIVNTISRGKIEPLKWLQKMGAKFAGDFEAYHALITLADSVHLAPEHRADRARMLRYTKEALEWLESMGITTEQCNFHKRNGAQSGVLLYAARNDNTVMIEWLAERIAKEDFAIVRREKLWTQIQTEMQERKMLLLILAARRMQQRAPPPEVWQQCVKPWLNCEAL